MNTAYAEIYYSHKMLRGKSLLEWAVLWFKMSNDVFFEMYGFNFNPHEYEGLYKIARNKLSEKKEEVRK
jgi:hypothetical protein